MFQFLQQWDGVALHPFVLQALVSLFLFWSITKLFYKTGKTKNLPPSPPKLPIIGNFHQLGSLPHHSLRSLAKKHGPIMLLHFGKKPVLVVSSADGAREILRTQDLNFGDRPDTMAARRLLYDHSDMASSRYNEYWRKIRGIAVLQLLSVKMVRSFHSIREEEMAVMTQKIRESSGPVNLSLLTIFFTYDVICRASFGRKWIEAEYGLKYLLALPELATLLGTVSIGDFVPWLSWVNRVNGLRAKSRKLAKEIDESLEGLIQMHLDIRKEQASEKKNGEDFFGFLLDSYRNKSTGVSIKKDTIKGLILDVVTGGTGTMSVFLEWAMTDILRHPTVMKKLQDEIRGITKGRNEIREEDYEKMHYLKAVVKEALRYRPPFPILIPRVARKDVKMMGYDIPNGSMVIVNGYAIGRDPAYWDEPEKFNPDRFLNSSRDFKGMDFGFIPFGSGRRGCPGLAYSVSITEFLIANLMLRFDWKLPNDGKDLDMTEKAPGFLNPVGRAVPLEAIATEYHYN